MGVLNSWTKLLNSLTKQLYYDANITIRICENNPHCSRRTVARKFSIGGFMFLRGGLTLQKLTKTQLIIVFHDSVWEGLELYLGELSPQKPHRGDGTV